VVSAVRLLTPSEKYAELSTTTPIPEECRGYEYFHVRAAGSKPFVVTNSSGAYLGRIAVGETFSITKPYFFHPYAPSNPDDPRVNYRGESQGTEVSIRLRPQTARQRGDRYVVNTTSNYFPFFSAVDITYSGEFRFFRLPGSVVQARIQVGKPEEPTYDYFAYIAYPSADGVLEMDLELVAPGAPSVRGLLPYR
jgi:hypothetical protein